MEEKIKELKERIRQLEIIVEYLASHHISKNDYEKLKEIKE